MKNVCVNLLLPYPKVRFCTVNLLVDLVRLAHLSRYVRYWLVLEHHAVGTTCDPRIGIQRLHVEYVVACENHVATGVHVRGAVVQDIVGANAIGAQAGGVITVEKSVLGIERC